MHGFDLDPTDLSVVDEIELAEGGLFESKKKKLSRGDEWCTPDSMLDLGRRVLGEFDFDPASTVAANKRVRAAWFYTKENDALAPYATWTTSALWGNPPYSSTLIGPFTDKFIAEYDNGNMKNGLWLTNAQTDAAWCQKLLARFVHCFLKKRISFLENGKPVKGNRNWQVIFCAGMLDVSCRFVEVFKDHGVIGISPFAEGPKE